MSAPIETISRQCIALQKLEQQMTELLALRRALCLANAARDRPKGSRRLYRASARLIPHLQKHLLHVGKSSLPL
jgi:hypothetical protein